MVPAFNVSEGDFHVQQEHKRVLLNYASIEEDSNKYYLLILEEGVGFFGNYRIFTEYGRIERKNIRRQARYFLSLHQAQKEFDKLIKSKKSKGYQEIEIEKKVDCTTIEDSFTIPDTTEEVLSRLKHKVMEFIDENSSKKNRQKKKTVKTPLGIISLNQVEKGVKILEQIESEIKKGTKISKVYTDLSNMYYSVIPCAFDVLVDKNKYKTKDKINLLRIDNFDKLNKHKKLLGI